MRPLPNDYDSDPGRFLSTGKHPHDDVHPYVAARFAAAGARTVLDVGGGHGRLARLLPRLSMRGLLVDLSPTMLNLAPRPSVRADGARLPVADASVDAVAALYTLYHYADPLLPIAEARRVLRPGGLFAACAANRDSDPELARVIPGWGNASPFDGEDAEAVVASVLWRSRRHGAGRPLGRPSGHPLLGSRRRGVPSGIRAQRGGGSACRCPSGPAADADQARLRGLCRQSRRAGQVWGQTVRARNRQPSCRKPGSS
jgi:SAM-dependent methyltransferase